MNKKVKNATPYEYEGIKFRSKLEQFTYKLFKEAKIALDYEAVSFELVPSFVFNGKKVRPMTYTPDFVHKDFIIECKGFGNDNWPIKEKLFKWLLTRNNLNYKFYVVKNQEEVKNLLSELIGQSNQ